MYPFIEIRRRLFYRLPQRITNAWENSKKLLFKQIAIFECVININFVSKQSVAKGCFTVTSPINRYSTADHATWLEWHFHIEVCIRKPGSQVIFYIFHQFSV